MNFANAVAHWNIESREWWSMMLIAKNRGIQVSLFFREKKVPFRDEMGTMYFFGQSAPFKELHRFAIFFACWIFVLHKMVVFCRPVEASTAPSVPVIHGTLATEVFQGVHGDEELGGPSCHGVIGETNSNFAPENRTGSSRNQKLVSVFAVGFTECSRWHWSLESSFFKCETTTSNRKTKPAWYVRITQMRDVSVIPQFILRDKTHKHLWTTVVLLSGTHICSVPFIFGTHFSTMEVWHCLLQAGIVCWEPLVNLHGRISTICRCCSYVVFVGWMIFIEEIEECNPSLNSWFLIFHSGVSAVYIPTIRCNQSNRFQIAQLWQQCNKDPITSSIRSGSKSHEECLMKNVIVKSRVFHG